MITDLNELLYAHILIFGYIFTANDSRLLYQKHYAILKSSARITNQIDP
jgi:hypothetical protein